MSLATIGCSDDVEIISSGGATDAGMTDAGATDDGMTDDGMTDDGMTDDGGDPTFMGGTYEITVMNLSPNQPMTDPVAAIHADTIHLFEVGGVSSTQIQTIAERGDNDPLTIFLGGSADVSDFAVIGAPPILPGASATGTLTTDNPAHVLSLVNMVICTNDAISGVDSVALPTDTTPLVITTMAYDAGTRTNVADADSFEPPPCSPNARTIPPSLTAFENIVAHPGQTGVVNPDPAAPGTNWDFAMGDDMLEITITLQP